MQHKLARGFEPRCHVGQPERNGLMLDDRPAERDALLGVCNGEFQRAARHPVGIRRDAYAAAFEIGHRDAVTLALLAQAIATGISGPQKDFAGVGGIQTHLPFHAPDAVSGMEVSTMKALKPRVPAVGSVTAITTAKSAVLPLVMNCLVPLSM